MKIDTIRVEGFKRFREPLTIDQLTDGINLIAAPNGKGKSTIAEAVRVGFLERHRAASLGETLAPWSEPGASPSVHIEFLRDGKRHRVAKTFGGKKSCSLEIEGAKPLSGEEAEQVLADMFAFSYAGKGTSKAEHQGVPGLLWVQQGSAGQIHSQVDNAHEYISRALGDDFGQLAATAGDRIIDQVHAELAELLTKTGKPTGAYQKAQEQLAAARTALKQLQATIAAYTDSVDRFTQLKAAYAKGERERPWNALRVQAASARKQLDALEQLQREREKFELSADVAKARAAQALQQLATFDAEDKAVKERGQALAEADEEDGQTLIGVRAAETQLQQAQDADTAARADSEAARLAAARQTHEDALVSAKARLEDLRDRLAKVEGYEADQAHQLELVARLANFAAAGKHLQHDESKVATARARLDAVATRLEYDLEQARVQVDGQHLEGAGSRTITEPAEIVIAGIGRIRVLPGAAELSSLKGEQARAENALRARLQSLGVETAEEARRQEEQLVAAKAATEQLGALIAGLAPEGLEALRANASTAEGEVARHESLLRGLAASPEQALSVEAAEAAEKVTQAALRQAQEHHQAARQRAAIAKEKVKLATQELASAQGKVNAAGREDRRRQAQADLLKAQAEEREADDQLSKVDGELRQAQPEQLRNDIKRWSDSALAHEAHHAETNARLQQLAGQLEAQGALGLQEEEAVAAEAVARLQREVDQHARQAAALSHLSTMLAAKRAEVARSIRAPLQKHVNRYLAIQSPGTSIELDEALRPARISRTGSHGPEAGRFEELSGGEREQMGIIARLAYADLLKEAGKPTLVMLDDSLVNTDAVRLASMKRVLYDAAQRHQILVFTCHQENWKDMGVVPRTLE